MTKKTSKEKTAWSTLGEYIEQRRKDLLLSRRALARDLNTDIGYLTRVVQNKITPGAEVCNRISDYFQDERSIALGLAGWLGHTAEENDDLFMARYKATVRNDPDFRELYDLYQKLDSPAQRRSLVRRIKEMIERK